MLGRATAIIANDLRLMAMAQTHDPHTKQPNAKGPSQFQIFEACIRVKTSLSLHRLCKWLMQYF